MGTGDGVGDTPGCSVTGISEVSRLLDDKAYYEKMSKATNPYGDGMACERIVNHLS